MWGNLNIKFDIKNMGFSVYIPFIVFAITIGVLLLLPSDEHTIINLIEVMFIPFAAWYPLYLFYDYYQNNGEELIVSYPIKKYTFFFLRPLIFLGFFNMLLIILILITYFKLPTLNLNNLLILFGSQSLFFFGLGLLLINLSKSIETSLAIVGSYISIEVISKGMFLPWAHVFVFDRMLNPNFSFIDIGFLNLIYAAIFLMITSSFIKTKKQVQKNTL